MLPIPIFIGLSHRFDCIKGMTERSILDHTLTPVEITYLYPEVESGCTGFTNVRYDITYGIYLDVDMIVLADIAELWAYRKPGKYVCMQDGQDAVAVIDCQHRCTTKYEKHLLPMSCDIPLEWNVEDYRYHGKALPENIKNFHFTDMSTQPWFYDHPNPEAVRLYERYKPRP